MIGGAIKKSKIMFMHFERISQHLFCPICQDVFEDPQRLRCGHTFCLTCINSWGSYSQVCPLCKDSLTRRRLEPDLTARNIINQLQVKCKHEECPWVGQYEELKMHQRGCAHKPKTARTEVVRSKLVEIQDDQIPVSQTVQVYEVSSQGNFGMEKQEQEFPAEEYIEQNIG